MSRAQRSRRRRARRALVLALPLLAALLGGLIWNTTRAPTASGAAAAGEVTPQTDASLPAKGVLLFGASPGEAPNETWGIGKLGSSNANPTWAIVRYVRAPVAAGAWAIGAPILDSSGQPLSGFAPVESPLTGDVANDGSGALLGTAPTGSGASRREVLLVRDPGHPFQAVAEPTLAGGEHLFRTATAPQLAALEEGGGTAGALLAPVQLAEGEGEPHVLHWDGHEWSSEPIELPAGVENFRVLAIAASSPRNAWLLGRVSADGVGLFHRVDSGGEEIWRPVSPAQGAPAGAPLQIAGESINEPERAKAQQLDVTEQGIWVDAEFKEHTLSASLFFEPIGETSGQISASWCAASDCTYSLSEPLPKGPSRSYAWAHPGTKYGDRVITGLPEGLTLRLAAFAEQPTFESVLALGSGSHQGESVGAQFGGAFSSPTEGWLGNQLLPVHLTTEPEPSMLQSWPVPFRRPLLAVAPQPGVAVGSRSSEALAVGVQGQVARYLPAEGWKPEGLLNGAGGRETPELRSVAWPTPSRAYAVGTLGRQGQIWLWRGETGLWEPDPGTPVNFRGKPLAVAFAAASPARGYIVGQQGLLLRYGKTWTQEPSCDGGAPQPCLPFSAKTLTTTSFTSVAFAGSEAIVAFRVAHFVSNGESSEFSYSESGLLVNDGSGWHVDTGVTAALGGDIPWAVAGLPDGGAAMSAESVGSGAPAILERESAGAPWNVTPQPYPGIALPGSLALFRENGSLRAIGSGSEPNTIQVDSSPEAPAGAPPTFIEPYPLASESSGTAGAVLRQTATGWRDEEHELNNAGPSLGNYQGNDLVYKPDPIWAVLVNEAGTEGWAVGGYVSESSGGRADTADVARYPGEAAAAPGVAYAAEATQPKHALIAFGGGSQCITPCALRARARIGPDVWLKSAIATAGAVLHVPDFVYMGPRVTSGRTEGPPERPVPYARELGRYGTLLHEAEASAGGQAHVYAAASPNELELGDGCPLFNIWTSGLATPPLALALAGKGCGPGEEASYYTFQAGAHDNVEVIVLDQSQGGIVQPVQESWLEARLAEARSHRQPAVVVGNSLPDRQTDVVLARGGAAAYFFEDPEENVKLVLKEHPGAGGPSVPAYGSGTLGYVSAIGAGTRDFRGASGFLLAEVPEALGEEVKVKLIPDIGELALEANDGTLLRRSHAAEFSALARRPLAGGAAASAGSPENVSYTYTPIPDNCEGEKCASAIKPEYTFSSSNEEVAAFVQRNEKSAEAKAVLLDSKEEPILSQGGKSGLLCAFNAGETTITVTSGGLSASEKVFVQAGSVRRPCGTTHRKNKGLTQNPPPPPGPEPGGSPEGSSPPVVPVPPPAAVPTPAHGAAPFVFQPSLAFAPFPAIVPPPLPTPNPSPPSGTSAVTSPVEAAQKEEEKEEATESVSNQAVAYRASEHDPAPAYLLGLAVLAAFAGAAGFRRRRAGREEARIAPATVTSAHFQRRAGRRDWRDM